MTVDFKRAEMKIPFFLLRGTFLLVVDCDNSIYGP